MATVDTKQKHVTTFGLNILEWLQFFVRFLNKDCVQYCPYISALLSAIYKFTNVWN